MAKYKTISLGTALNYYKSVEIQNAIVECADDKEAIGSYSGKGYAKRPDILVYPSDVLESVKKGVTSFHISEERWQNPLILRPGMPKKELDEQRIGWDLVIDIDCPFLEYSKIAAHYLIKAMQHHGIKNISCKFSGNHGFHIGLPFESFPQIIKDTQTRLLFPEGPRRITEYLKEMIREHFAKHMLEQEDVDEIMKKTGTTFDEVVKDGMFDPYTVLELDTILISSRHLYRMAYSFNEKSGLISIPIDPEDVLNFDINTSKPEVVNVNKFKFLDPENIIPGEATKLIVQAFDYIGRREEKKKTAEETVKEYNSESLKEKEFEELEVALPEIFFPPCIKKMLKGMEDGKKRCLFLLVNFFQSVGWKLDDIQTRLTEWNKNNPEPLREVYITGQIRYSKQQKEKVLPPNCNNIAYYKDLGFCEPDGFCKFIKNPVPYVVKKAKMAEKEEKAQEKEELKRQKRKDKQDAEKKKLKLIKEKNAADAKVDADNTKDTSNPAPSSDVEDKDADIKTTSK